MKTKKANSKNLLALTPWLAWGAIGVLVLILSSENLGRALVIFAFLLLWAFLAKIKGTLKASILLFLFALPFNITIAFSQLVDPYVAGVYVNYLVPIVSILDIFALLALLSSVSMTGSLKALLSKCSPLSLIFLIYAVIHLAIHPEINSAAWIARFALYALFAWTALSFSKDLFNDDFRKDIGKVFIASVAIQLVIGGLQFLLGKSIGLSIIGESQLLSGALGTSSIKLSEGEFLRAYGTFPHPNVLSGYLLFVSIISAYLYKLKPNRISLITIILSGFLMVFTFSRVSILLAIFAAVVILFPKFKKGLNILIFERFGTLFTGNDYSLGDRVTLTKSAFRVIHENLFAGSGAGSFVRQLASDVPYTASGISLLQPVHNIFLLVLAEHGIFAGMLLIAVMFWFKIKQIINSVGPIKMFRIIAFISILVVGMFDHYLLTLPQGISIFLISLFL